MSLHDLPPQLSEDELKNVEETLMAYFDLCLRIYERISNDPPLYAEFKALLNSENEPNMSVNSTEQTSISPIFDHHD